MENAPQMTPEQIAAMQEQQPPEGQVTPDPGQQPAQQPIPQQAPEDELATARDALGINAQNTSIEALQGQMLQMQQAGVTEKMAAKYPDIPFDLVQKEIDKVAAIDPDFADSMKTTEPGMDMAYKAAMAGIKPTEKPDNLTDGEGGGETIETLEAMVKEGKADDFQLGDYILAQS